MFFGLFNIFKRNRRKFEVASKEKNTQFTFPTDIIMPRRSTRFSAGYDIYNNTGKNIEIAPGESSDAIPTFLKVHLHETNFLAIVPRSSHGFKYAVRLNNTIGIIDCDYYGNEKNDGHIMVKLRNAGKTPLIIPPGEAMAQGIFLEYLITEDDASTIGGTRTSGIGSTTKS